MLNVRRSLLVAVILGFFLSLSLYSASAQGQSLTVRGDRWLSIVEVSGNVELIPYEGTSRRARRGDRLTRVGDLLITGDNASARLEVDQRAGIVTMAENSQLQIQTLSITSSGGRITELAVSRGQVRLRVRPLTNPGSRLEIHTPAGVSGVRGTDFGLTIQPDGQTGVATLEGSVFAAAQGQSVVVSDAQQSSIYPGEPPTPPEPLRDDPTLYIEVLSGSRDGPTARVVGYTDTVNLFELNGEIQNLDRAGRFDLEVPIPIDGRILARIITPLGTEQQYELAVP
jgi:hypothetical protein